MGMEVTMIASFWQFVTPEATGTQSYYRAKTPAKQNPKFEYRNPKQTETLKSEI
jgi:hypothetical protein